MTEHDYRTTRAYSVSDLNELDRLMKGELPWATYWHARYYGMPYHITDPKILRFGSTLHQMALEPDKPVVDEWHNVDEWERLYRMEKQLTPYIDQVFIKYPCEVELSSTCPITGLLIKGKVDCLTDEAVVDIKTTSCMKSESFYATFEKYGYWRQAAFYLHLTNLERFMFLGIGKKQPHPV
ncbi:PD-(D/E)XK nuclease-like domain-containing protein, partial [Larkinella knui]